MELTAQLTPMLRTLRLSGVLATLEVRNRQAIESRSSFVEFLTAPVPGRGGAARPDRALGLRLRRAAFDATKTLEGFDFSFNPKLNKAQVFDLATCQFVERHENVLIYGPTGVGKSHLGPGARPRGVPPRVRGAASSPQPRCSRHLAGGRADGTTAHRLARYLRPDLLVLDDFGLKPLRAPGPEDLYDIIHERYERASILLTSNRDPVRMGRPLRRALARLGRPGSADPPGPLPRDHGPELPGRAHQAAPHRPPADVSRRQRSNGPRADTRLARDPVTSRAGSPWVTLSGSPWATLDSGRWPGPRRGAHELLLGSPPARHASRRPRLPDPGGGLA